MKERAPSFIPCSRFPVPCFFLFFPAEPSAQARRYIPASDTPSALTRSSPPYSG